MSKHDLLFFLFFFISLSFVCEKEKVALLPLACIIAGLHSPLWIWPWFLLPPLLFLPLLRSLSTPTPSTPALPPWLGAFREYLLLFWVCLRTVHRWRFRHPACQTPRWAYQARAVTSLAVTSCSTRQAFICMYHMFEANRSCFAR